MHQILVYILGRLRDAIHKDWPNVTEWEGFEIIYNLEGDEDNEAYAFVSCVLPDNVYPEVDDETYGYQWGFRIYPEKQD